MSFFDKTAPLARQFRSCLEATQTLHAALLSRDADGTERLSAEVCQGEIGRLSLWDQDVRASTGELDHTLRKSARLWEQIYELLCQLDEALKNAQSIQGGEDLVHEDSASDIILSSSSTSEDGLDGIILRPRSPLSTWLFEVEDIVTEMLRLAPLLEHPPSNEIGLLSKSSDAAFPDINRVAQKFSSASSELVRTLGVLVWSRRQELMSIRRFNEETLTTSRLAERELSGHDYLEQPYQSIARLDSDSFPHQTADHTVSTPSVSRNKSFADFSTITKSFAGTKITSITNASENMGRDILSDSGAKHSSWLDQLRRVPRPPSPNQDFGGVIFKCPYCTMFLGNVKDPRTWGRHVMIDLEPYVCTDEGCLRLNRKFQTRRTWFNHEMETHRRPRFWKCSICEMEFQAQKYFERHLFEDHSKTFTPSMLDSIIKACENISGDVVQDIKCPLCGINCEDETRFKKHVAEELEQVALFSIPNEINLEDTILDAMEDWDSDTELDIGQSDLILSSDLPEDASDLQRDKRHVNEFPVRLRGEYSPGSKPPNDAVVEELIQSQVEIIIKERVLSRTRNPSVSFPVTTVKQNRDQDFYGRTLLLEQLHDTLQRKGQICVIYGLGGVGKTLLALEYVTSFAGSYDCTFWLQADTEPGIIESSYHIAETLGMLDGTEEPNQAVEISREWLEKTDKSWLAVVDNVDHWDAVHRALPPDIKRANGSVIITTQSAQFSKYADLTLNLAPLDGQEGADMLLHYLRRCALDEVPDSSLAREISDIVGGLPVSIGLVANYIASSRDPVQDATELLDVLRECKQYPASENTSSHDTLLQMSGLSYEATLQVVCDFFLRELPRDSRDLMYILAYLNGDGIPESILWAVHDHPSLAFLNPKVSHRHKRTINALVRWRLIQIKDVDGESCLSIHRELQRAFRKSVSEDRNWQEVVFNQAVIIVQRSMPESSPIQVPEEGKWPQYRRLLPHVSSLRNVYIGAKGKIHGSMAFAKVLSDAGINQWDQGITKEGMQLLLTAEKVLQNDINDISGPLAANIHCVIGLMMQCTGISQRTEALRRALQVLAIRQRLANERQTLTREEDVLLCNAHSDLALALLQFNDYKQAEPLFEKCHRKYKQWDSEDDIPFEYGKYYYALSKIRMYQKDYEAAIHCAKQANYFMGKHGNTAFASRCQFVLASIILQTGKVKEALELHEDILKARKFKSGRYSELTLDSYYAVAVLHATLGELDHAEFMLQKVLDRHLASNWGEEPVARAKYHLSRVLREKNKDLNEAERLYDEAKAVLDRVLPLDMPAWLAGEEDEEILFDHICTDVSRFTGRGLLSRFHNYFEPTSMALAPENVMNLVQWEDGNA